MADAILMQAATAAAQVGLWERGPEGWDGHASLVEWWSTRRRLTLNSTMRTLGASTPPTLSSTSSLSQLIPIWATVRTAGTGGIGATARVDISLDSGNRILLKNVAAEADVPLLGTDLTVHFSGALLLNDVFQPAVDVLTGVKAGQVLTAVQRPLLETKGLNNVFGRKCRGLQRWPTLDAEACLMSSAAGNGSAAALSGAAWTVQWVGRLVGNLTAGTPVSFTAAGGAVSTTPFISFGHNGAGNWQVRIRNNASTALGEVGGTTDNAHDHVFSARYDGANLVLRVDGVEVINTPKVIGAITLSIFSVLGMRRSNGVTFTDDSFVLGYLSYCAVYATALTDGELARNESRLANYLRTQPQNGNVKVTIIGDSQTASFPGSFQWPEQILWENDAPEVNNLAFNGAKVSDWVQPANLANIQASFDGGKDNLAIIICGENDIGTDGSGDESALLTNYTSLLASMNGFGFTNILNGYMMRRGNPQAPAYTAKKATFDAFIDGVTSPGKIINTNSIPGTPGDGIWWLSSDVVHLNEQGQCFLSDLIQPIYRWAIHGLS